MEQALCFFTAETNYRNSPSPFGIKMADRLSGIPIHVDISDLPMKQGLIANTNKFVCGPSGTGKSFFMNHLIRQYYEQGTHVFIVDIGNSYKGLCDLIHSRTRGEDGIYLTYEQGENASFNPFYTEDGQYDMDTRESIRMVLLTLWKCENEPPTRAEEVALSNAVSMYLSQMQKQVSKPSFNGFYEFIRGDYRIVLRQKNVREKDFDVDNFLHVLEPYYKGGEFDYLLNSDRELDLLNKRFVVFELDAIREHKILLPIVTLMLMTGFMRKIRILKGIRKMLVLEEAWAALMNQGMSSFVRYAYKTFRKHFAEICVVTQELTDLLSNPIVKDSILANADTRILLDVKKYANRFTEIENLLGLSAKEKEQILTINRNNSSDRKYKEVWIGLGGAYSAVYATEVSRQEYLCYTTVQTEKKEVFDLAERFDGNLELAISQLAEKNDDR